jgi:filamentous hemagglutinin family protein
MSSAALDQSHPHGVVLNNGTTILGPEYLIHQQYGTTQGQNLFHNFHQFNIYSNESVRFKGENSIQNVICRISGNEYSWINGDIYMDIQKANLFLLNPNGFIFGPNSSIHMNGAFHTSSADYIRMDDGHLIYSTVTNDDILSCASPKSFGFLKQTNSSIEFINTQLSNSSISIVGGDVLLQNSKIKAAEGDIFLASLDGKGEISINGENRYMDIVQKGEIKLKDNSTIDVSGQQSGNIVIYSKDLLLTNMSGIEANNKGKGGGEIYLKSNNIYLSDQSCIKSESILLPGANHSLLSDEQNVKGGNVTIHASDSLILLDSDIKSLSVSFIDHSNHIVDAGDVTIQTRQMVFKNSSISSGSIDGGKSGNISIIADESFLFEGYLSYVRNSLDSVHGSDAGNINIQSSNIIFADGAGINTHVHGGGEGGDVALLASNSIQFYGIENGHSSRISSTTFNEKELSGWAGDVFIHSPFVSFQDGAGITASSYGTGNGGKVQIIASEFECIGANLLEGYRSGINSASNSSDMNAGNAGQVNITTNSLNIADGAAINTEAQHAGGGAIQIDCNHSITLLNSEISTSVKDGQDKSGDISIQSSFVILNHSTIKANAYEGDGGAIFIGTEHYIKSSDSIIVASSKRGNDGIITIEAPDLDFTGDLTALSENLLHADAWLRTPCHMRSSENDSHLFTLSRDGIPTLFDDLLAGYPFIFEKKELDQIASCAIKKTLIHGELLYEKGDFSEAIVAFNKELDSINTKNIPLNTYVKRLVYLSSSFQAIGHFQKALSIIENGLQHTEKYNHLFGKAVLNCCLSDIYLLLNQSEKARQLSKKAQRHARNSGNVFLNAYIENHKGNLLVIDEDHDGAISAYQKSLERIKQLSQSRKSKQKYQFFQSRVLMNYSRVLWMDYSSTGIGSLLPVFSSVQKAFNTITTLPESYEKAALLISTGILANKIKKYCQQEKVQNEVCQSPDLTKHLDIIYQQSCYQALHVSDSMKNNQIKSAANGFLGEFYLKQNNYSEALLYTKKALFYSYQDYLPEWQYVWLWQLGKLYKAIGKLDLFIDMLTSAQQILKPECKSPHAICCPGIVHEFFNGFRLKIDIVSQRIKPLYQELSEFYLKQSKKMHSKASEQELLMQVIENMENLKIVEMQNYFKDECIEKNMNTVSFKKLDHHCAILYPVEMSDNLIILLIAPDEIKPFAIDVPYNHFQTWATRFVERVQDTRRTQQYLLYAYDLYDWLIRPVENELEKHHIQTLFIAPDGIMRAIPFAALKDRNSDQFLIEKYSLAIIPSLKMIHSRHSVPSTTKILLAGLSVTRHGFPPLFNVTDEIDHIGHSSDKTKLLNKDFTTQNLRLACKKEEYHIIHISTHAIIGDTCEDTYLLAYNKKIFINEFTDIIRLNKYHETPLDIITLSACETAIGDQKAALGLAGLAVKSGARSALASLWSIDDHSSVSFVTEFYHQLLSEKQSKVKSLQIAQQKLIDHSDLHYRHPAHWAPFILVEMTVSVIDTGEPPLD